MSTDALFQLGIVSGSRSAAQKEDFRSPKALVRLASKSLGRLAPKSLGRLAPKSLGRPAPKPLGRLASKALRRIAPRTRRGLVASLAMPAAVACRAPQWSANLSRLSKALAQCHGLRPG